ncbi:MAG: hypothetical protein IJM35_09295 [Bacteroidales bacterium]|nr:hypothetical protein [Bacteroidales bacterium]
MKKLIILLSLVICLSSHARGIKVDNRLPAGNIEFERVSNDTVFVHQELRDTQGDWFYWAFRIRGAQGRTLTFVFTQSRAVGVRGPVVSLDRGKTFEYGPVTNLSRHTFTYTFPKNVRQVWMCECHPYGPERWKAFVKRLGGVPFEAGTLCKSRKGRDLPCFRIGSGPVGIVLSARHHCSEASASYVLEGIVAAFAEKSGLGEMLRVRFTLWAVPFIDLDGAVEGDQGKNRQPHDHNRDYTEFLYPETRALANLLKQVDPKVFLDLHAPGLVGYTHEFIYCPLSDPAIGVHEDKETQFSALVEKNQEGNLRYKVSDDLPFGKAWNTSANYSVGSSAKKWALQNIRGIDISRTMEFPFANANGAVVTPEALRKFGHGMARALLEMYE